MNKRERLEAIVMVGTEVRKHRPFEWAYGEGVYGRCLWFRVFGYGLHFKKHDAGMLFSERHGYRRYYTFFGLRMRVLTP